MNTEIVLSFISAFFITYGILPIIIKVGKLKNLIDEPNERASHKTSVPTLGGLGIFVGFILSITFWTDFTVYSRTLQFMEFALVLVFFLGIKDDIIALDPSKKMLGLLIAASGIVIGGDLRITSFYGIFGIYDIPYSYSVAITIFTILTIVNAFNLIDGINGLCSSSGVISSIAFGIWFYLVGDDVSIQWVIIIGSLVGSLIAFLRYNITPAKIFMGDTGSLLIGLLLSVFAIKFLETNKVITSEYKLESPVIVAVGIIILPLSDMLKVFTLRLIKKKSPFYPDKTHIHHILLKLGLTHTKATIVLSLISIFFIVMVLTLHRLGNLYLGIILIGTSAVASTLPNYLLYLKNKKAAK